MIVTAFSECLEDGIETIHIIKTNCEQHTLSGMPLRAYGGPTICLNDRWLGMVERELCCKEWSPYTKTYAQYFTLYELRTGMINLLAKARFSTSAYEICETLLHTTGGQFDAITVNHSM